MGYFTDFVVHNLSVGGAPWPNTQFDLVAHRHRPEGGRAVEENPAVPVIRQQLVLLWVPDGMGMNLSNLK